MWGFGTIVNGLAELLHCDLVVPPGASTSGGALNASRGNAMLTLGTLGAVYLTDLGEQPGGPYPCCVNVTWGTNTKPWYYADGDLLDVQADQDGTFTLAGAGQTITGNVTA